MKIYGEHTRPTDSPSLCGSCRNATTVRGTRFGDDITRCSAGLGVIRFVVTECSAYDDANEIPLYELKTIAWCWYDERFVSPAELMRIRQHDIDDDDDEPPVISKTATRPGWFARAWDWITS